MAADQYVGKDLVEMLKSLAAEQAGALMFPVSGTVTSVDPNNYMVKVMLGALGIETGWLPLGTIYAGPGFGFWALPEQGTGAQPGAEVTVLFEMGNPNAGKVILSNWNDTDPPPTGLLPGDAALVHKSGSKLHFHIDGSAELDVATVLKLAGGGAAVARVGDNVNLTTGKIVSGSSVVQCG